MMLPTIHPGRLRWRASRHALLELDLVFARFLQKHFDTLDAEQLVALEKLLDYEDADLWAIVSSRRECEQAQLKGLVNLLRSL